MLFVDFFASSFILYPLPNYCNPASVNRVGSVLRCASDIAISFGLKCRVACLLNAKMPIPTFSSTFTFFWFTKYLTSSTIYFIILVTTSVESIARSAICFKSTYTTSNSEGICSVLFSFSMSFIPAP